MDTAHAANIGMGALLYDHTVTGANVLLLGADPDLSTAHGLYRILLKGVTACGCSLYGRTRHGAGDYLSRPVPWSKHCADHSAHQCTAGMPGFL